MSLDALKAALERRVGPLYFVLGDEDLLVRRAETLIADVALGGGLPALNRSIRSPMPLVAGWVDQYRNARMFPFRSRSQPRNTTECPLPEVRHSWTKSPGRASFRFSIRTPRPRVTSAFTGPSRLLLAQYQSLRSLRSSRGPRATWARPEASSSERWGASADSTIASSLR